jgi:hypothetical protein
MPDPNHTSRGHEYVEIPAFASAKVTMLENGNPSKASVIEVVFL